MQGRQRNSGDGFRSGSGYRNFNRGGFNRGNPKPYHPPPPPPSKAEILMEAGRLAAEYLASQGLLPPNSLPGKWQNGKFQEFRGLEREPHIPEGRTSALARLGNAVPDPGHGRRRYQDEFLGSRNYPRGRKRNSPYGRGHSSEWGRDNGRKVPWMGRAREYPNSMEEEEDEEEFAPGYQGARRARFDEVRSSGLRPGNEFMGESRWEVENREVADDTGSKASSSSTKKDPLPEVDADSNKVVGDVVVSNSEAGDEVKSDASGDLKKKNDVHDDEIEVQDCAVEGDLVDKQVDLLKLCGFAKMPTRRRSSVTQKIPNGEQGPCMDASNTIKIGDDAVKGFVSDSQVNQSNTTECQEPVFSSIPPDQTMEESVDPQHESNQSPPGFVTENKLGDASEGGSFGSKKETDSSPSRVPEEDCYSVENLSTKKSSPCHESLQIDEEMVEAVDQDKPVDELEPEFNVKLEEEKEILPNSFRICDLNLIGTHGIMEIPEDPMIDHLHTSVPLIENGKEIEGKVGISIGNNASDTNSYACSSDDDKVVPVIDLEDDSPIDKNTSDSSKLKNETIYPSLDNFLGPSENTDIAGIQDGYSLAFSEFLGADIPGCPSVQADLNNLQAGISLHDAEEVPGNDDPIYVSLGEISIGFMDVWDQAPQEYGKFF